MICDHSFQWVNLAWHFRHRKQQEVSWMFNTVAGLEITVEMHTIWSSVQRVWKILEQNIHPVSLQWSLNILISSVLSSINKINSHNKIAAASISIICCCGRCYARGLQVPLAVSPHGLTSKEEYRTLPPMHLVNFAAVWMYIRGKGR
jgi:hypothetical protein